MDASPRQVIPPFSYYFGMMLLNVIAITVVFFFYKLYHLRRGTSQLDELYSIFTAVSISVIVVCIVPRSSTGPTWTIRG